MRRRRPLDSGVISYSIEEEALWYGNRRFKDQDAQGFVAHRQTFARPNHQTIPGIKLKTEVNVLTPEYIAWRASWTFRLHCDGDAIIGCGAIGNAGAGETESNLFTILSCRNIRDAALDGEDCADAGSGQICHSGQAHRDSGVHHRLLDSTGRWGYDYKHGDAVDEEDCTGWKFR